MKSIIKSSSKKGRSISNEKTKAIPTPVRRSARNKVVSEPIILNEIKTTAKGRMRLRFESDNSESSSHRCSSTSGNSSVELSSISDIGDSSSPALKEDISSETCKERESPVKNINDEHYSGSSLRPDNKSIVRRSPRGKKCPPSKLVDYLLENNQNSTEINESRGLEPPSSPSTKIIRKEIEKYEDCQVSTGGVTLLLESNNLFKKSNNTTEASECSESVESGTCVSNNNSVDIMSTQSEIDLGFQKPNLSSTEVPDKSYNDRIEASIPHSNFVPIKEDGINFESSDSKVGEFQVCSSTEATACSAAEIRTSKSNKVSTFKKRKHRTTFTPKKRLKRTVQEVSKKNGGGFELDKNIATMATKHIMENNVEEERVINLAPQQTDSCVNTSSEKFNGGEAITHIEPTSINMNESQACENSPNELNDCNSNEVSVPLSHKPYNNSKRKPKSSVRRLNLNKTEFLDKDSEKLVFEKIIEANATELFMENKADQESDVTLILQQEDIFSEKLNETFDETEFSTLMESSKNSNIFEPHKFENYLNELNCHIGNEVSALKKNRFKINKKRRPTVLSTKWMKLKEKQFLKNNSEEFISEENIETFSLQNLEHKVDNEFDDNPAPQENRVLVDKPDESFSTRGFNSRKEPSDIIVHKFQASENNTKELSDFNGNDVSVIKSHKGDRHTKKSSLHVKRGKVKNMSLTVSLPINADTSHQETNLEFEEPELSSIVPCGLHFSSNDNISVSKNEDVGNLVESSLEKSDSFALDNSKQDDKHLSQSNNLYSGKDKILNDNLGRTCKQSVANLNFSSEVNNSNSSNTGENFSIPEHKPLPSSCGSECVKVLRSNASDMEGGNFQKYDVSSISSDCDRENNISEGKSSTSESGSSSESSAEKKSCRTSKFCSERYDLKRTRTSDEYSSSSSESDYLRSLKSKMKSIKCITDNEDITYSQIKKNRKKRQVCKFTLSRFILKRPKDLKFNDIPHKSLSETGLECLENKTQDIRSNEEEIGPHNSDNYGGKVVNANETLSMNPKYARKSNQMHVHSDGHIVEKNKKTFSKRRGKEQEIPLDNSVYYKFIPGDFVKSSSDVNNGESSNHSLKSESSTESTAEMNLNSNVSKNILTYNNMSEISESTTNCLQNDIKESSSDSRHQNLGHFSWSQNTEGASKDELVLCDKRDFSVHKYGLPGNDNSLCRELVNEGRKPSSHSKKYKGKSSHVPVPKDRNTPQNPKTESERLEETVEKLKNESNESCGDSRHQNLAHCSLPEKTEVDTKDEFKFLDNRAFSSPKHCMPGSDNSIGIELVYEGRKYSRKYKDKDGHATASKESNIPENLKTLSKSLGGTIEKLEQENKESSGDSRHKNLAHWSSPEKIEVATKEGLMFSDKRASSNPIGGNDNSTCRELLNIGRKHSRNSKKYKEKSSPVTASKERNTPENTKTESECLEGIIEQIKKESKESCGNSRDQKLAHCSSPEKTEVTTKEELIFPDKRDFSDHKHSICGNDNSIGSELVNVGIKHSRNSKKYKEDSRKSASKERNTPENLKTLSESPSGTIGKLEKEKKQSSGDSKHQQLAHCSSLEKTEITTKDELIFPGKPSPKRGFFDPKHSILRNNNSISREIVNVGRKHSSNSKKYKEKSSRVPVSKAHNIPENPKRVSGNLGEVVGKLKKENKESSGDSRHQNLAYYSSPEKTTVATKDEFKFFDNRTSSEPKHSIPGNDNSIGRELDDEGKKHSSKKYTIKNSAPASKERNIPENSKTVSECPEVTKDKLKKENKESILDSRHHYFSQDSSPEKTKVATRDELMFSDKRAFGDPIHSIPGNDNSEGRELVNVGEKHSRNNKKHKGEDSHVSLSKKCNILENPKTVSESLEGTKEKLTSDSGTNRNKYNYMSAVSIPMANFSVNELESKYENGAQRSLSQKIVDGKSNELTFSGNAGRELDKSKGLHFKINKYSQTYTREKVSSEENSITETTKTLSNRREVKITKWDKRSPFKNSGFCSKLFSDDVNVSSDLNYGCHLNYSNNPRSPNRDKPSKSSTTRHTLVTNIESLVSESSANRHNSPHKESRNYSIDIMGSQSLSPVNIQHLTQSKIKTHKQKSSERLVSSKNCKIAENSKSVSKTQEGSMKQLEKKSPIADSGSSPRSMLDDLKKNTLDTPDHTHHSVNWRSPGKCAAAVTSSLNTNLIINKKLEISEQTNIKSLETPHKEIKCDSKLENETENSLPEKTEVGSNDQSMFSDESPKFSPLGNTSPKFSPVEEDSFDDDQSDSSSVIQPLDRQEEEDFGVFEYSDLNETELITCDDSGTVKETCQSEVPAEPLKSCRQTAINNKRCKAVLRAKLLKRQKLLELMKKANRLAAVRNKQHAKKLGNKMLNSKKQAQTSTKPVKEQLLHPSREPYLDSDLPMTEIHYKGEALGGFFGRKEDGCNFLKIVEPRKSSRDEDNLPYAKLFIKVLRPLCQYMLLTGSCEKGSVCNSVHKVPKDYLNQYSMDDVLQIQNFVFRIADKISEAFFDALFEYFALRNKKKQLFDLSFQIVTWKISDSAYFSSIWEKLFNSLQKCGLKKHEAIKGVISHNFSYISSWPLKKIAKLIDVWNLKSQSVQNIWTVIQPFTCIQGLQLDVQLLSKLLSEVIFFKGPETRSILKKCADLLLFLPPHKLQDISASLLKDFVIKMSERNMWSEADKLRVRAGQYTCPGSFRSCTPDYSRTENKPKTLQRSRSVDRLTDFSDEFAEKNQRVYEDAKMISAITRALNSENYNAIVSTIYSCSKEGFINVILLTVYKYLIDKKSFVMMKKILNEYSKDSRYEECELLFGTLVVTFVVVYVAQGQWELADQFYSLFDEYGLNKYQVKPLVGDSYSPVKVAVIYSEIHLYNNRHREAISEIINLKLVNPPEEWVLKATSKKDINWVKLLVDTLFLNFMRDNIINIAVMLFKRIVDVQIQFNTPIDLTAYFEPLLYKLFEFDESGPETALQLYFIVSRKVKDVPLSGLTFRALLIHAYKFCNESTVNGLFFKAIEKCVYPIFEERENTIMIHKSMTEDEIYVYIRNWLSWFRKKLNRNGIGTAGHEVKIELKNIHLKDFLENKDMSIPRVLQGISEEEEDAMTRVANAVDRCQLGLYKVRGHIAIIHCPSLKACLDKIII